MHSVYPDVAERIMDRVNDKVHLWKGTLNAFMNIRDEKYPLVCLEVMAVYKSNILNLLFLSS